MLSQVSHHVMTLACPVIHNLTTDPFITILQPRKLKLILRNQIIDLRSQLRNEDLKTGSLIPEPGFLARPFPCPLSTVLVSEPEGLSKSFPTQ